VLISLIKGVQTKEPATNNSVLENLLEHNMCYCILVHAGT